MIHRIVMISLLLWTLPAEVEAVPEFNHDAACTQAYNAYFGLRPAEGDRWIREALAAQPDNLMATYISDYGDFLTLLFNGDPALRNQYFENQEARLKRIATASDKNPWKRYCQAGLYLHATLIHGRMGEQFRAATTFRRSFLLLRENASRFPQFAQNSILYGIEEAIAGSIPEEYAWISRLFGMKADLNHGLNLLAAWLHFHPEPATPFREEALISESYLRFYLAADKNSIWNRIGSDQEFDIRGNLLRCFVRTNIALSYRKADAAQAALKQAYGLAGVNDYPAFDYEMGNTLLLRLDPSAGSYFARFISRNKGSLYTKDALQQLALAAYLRGEKEKAQKLRSLILNHGSLSTDADRQAQRFAKNEQWPHPLLLTARLLIDGGYPAQALSKLRSSSAASFSSLPDRLEYDFRLGRALEDCGTHSEAVQAYQRVINAGADRPEYFAARSALQMAGIYEQHGQKEYAIRYYKLCLSMRHHDFQASLDQQAKAGLSRLQ